EHRPGDDQIQAGVTARNRVADPIALVGVEEQDLVHLGDGVVRFEMSDEEAAIGKDQVRGVGAFLVAAIAAATGAAHVPDRDELALEERSGGDVGHDSLVPLSPRPGSNRNAFASFVPSVLGSPQARGVTTTRPPPAMRRVAGGLLKILEAPALSPVLHS